MAEFECISQDRDKEAAFWDEISHKQEEWILNTPKDEIIENILHNYQIWWEDLIGKVKGKTILDIGCGDTYFVAYWNLTGNTARGSDFSSETVRTNNLLHKKLGMKEDFYLASSESIDAPDNSLDLIHMRWVVHHIPPELQDVSMQEMKRVLKKGGQIIAYETNYLFPFRWLVQTPLFRQINPLRHYAIKKHWLDPEEKALKNKNYLDLFKRNGFTIKKVDYDYTFFAYPAWLFTHNKKFQNMVEYIDRFLAYFTPTMFSKDIKIVAEK